MHVLTAGLRWVEEHFCTDFDFFYRIRSLKLDNKAKNQLLVFHTYHTAQVPHKF